jgi:hypothetical protein
MDTRPGVPNVLVGEVTRPTSATPRTRAMFNMYDGAAYADVAHLDHLLYMLGDGLDAVTSPPPARLPPQPGASSPPFDYPNNILDPERDDPRSSDPLQKLHAERVSFTGEFILVSAGPDKVFGLEHYRDSSLKNLKRSEVDDIYNFERK